jgi:hypothetical protein
VKHEPGDLRRRVRLVLGWVLTALLITVYFALPDGESAGLLHSGHPGADETTETRRLDILDVSPSDTNPGSAITVTYVGANDERDVSVFMGKERLPVLARREGSVVAQLPTDLELGRVKIRVTSGGERSKPYDVRIKATNWRKPFRSLLGGLALLVFGIGILARGAREAAGRESARALARLAGRGPAALLLGTAVGALAQSTTAAAGLLAGLVASSLLAIGPAASAFVGAQLGAASAPLVTGLIDPREGLLIVAVGVLWLAVAYDRRARALARLVLGAGLIALGLQTLRPGFEPFVQEPTLLSFVTSLRASGPGDVAICALLGVGLVALLQGPAPVVVLVLALAQTTAQWDLRTALGVLAGSGLGSAVGALLTTPRGARGRRLAELYLVLGALGTFFTACTVDVWATLADRVVPGVPHEIAWGKRILLPNLGLHLGVAFAFSQLASALLLLPFVPRLLRLLERLFPQKMLPELSKIGDARGVVERGLAQVLAVERDGLARLSDLALEGRRDAGGYAEHRLADAHARTEELLAGPVLALPETPEGDVLSRVAFSSLRLLRALEELHRQAERFTDSRLALAAGEAEIAPLPTEDVEVISEMHALLTSGLGAVAEALESRLAVDVEGALGREIRMNGLEARVRSALQGGSRDPVAVQRRLGVLELVNAYETSGNQLYRLIEALAELAEPASFVRSTAGIR